MNKKLTLYNKSKSRHSLIAHKLYRVVYNKQWNAFVINYLQSVLEV